MATKDYSIDSEKIEQNINDFAGQNGLEVATKHNSTNTVYTLSKGKEDCKITVYHKNNGKTSFLSQGKLQSLGEKCIEYVIEKTSLPNDINKTLTIKKCNVDLFEDFKDSIKMDYNTSDIESNDNNIKNRFAVQDKRNASVTITLYNTDTLLIQGSVTTLFIKLIVFALETMTNEQLNDCLGLQNTICGKISEEIGDHINNTQPLEEDDGVLIKMIKTSLQLANSGIKVDDYSCYTFSILRAIEGVLKKRLSEDAPLGDIDFGNFFEKRRGVFVFKNSVSTYNNNKPLKNALEETYNFFNKHRHRTFHTDEMIETSVILNFDEAINIITEALKLINRICKNW